MRLSIANSSQSTSEGCVVSTEKNITKKMAQYSALSESYEKEPDKWDGNSLGKFSENLGIVDGL